MVDELLKKGSNFPARNDLTQERGKDYWRRKVHTLRNTKKM
jgi:hypothetical protein